MDFFRKQIAKAEETIRSRGLLDTRVLALFGVGVIAISIFWNGAGIIQQNYDLAQKTAAIEQENEILELENRNKELQNEYLATDEFAEITARRVFGRAAPGERVYILPEEVALNALSEPPIKEEVEVTIEKPQWQQHVESWLNIYFGE